MRIVSLHEEPDLCMAAIQKAEQESKGDRLADNYTKNKLNLNQMIMFNFVFDEDNPVLMSGCQKITKDVVRVFSRYYHFKDYRTDGSNMFEKVDDFMELQYSLDFLSGYAGVIWTRDKSPGFFKKIKKDRPVIFSDWNVYPDKVKILYPDNYQYVFYTGNISSLTHPTM